MCRLAAATLPHRRFIFPSSSVHFFPLGVKTHFLISSVEMFHLANGGADLSLSTLNFYAPARPRPLAKVRSRRPATAYFRCDPISFISCSGWEQVCVFGTLPFFTSCARQIKTASENLTGFVPKNGKRDDLTSLAFSLASLLFYTICHSFVSMQALSTALHKASMWVLSG